jgi:hypothetical protein
VRIGYHVSVVRTHRAIALAVLTGCGRIHFAEVASGAPQWVEQIAGAADNASLAEIATSTAIGGDAGDLFVAVVSVKPSHAIAAVAGLGLTWRPIHDQCSGRDTARLGTFWAQGEASSPGTVAAKLDTSSPFVGAAVLSVHRYRGVDPVSPIGNASWANTNGADGVLPCTGGIDTASYDWSTLHTATPDSVVFVAAHTARYTHAPGTGFTERTDVQSADLSGSAGIAVEDIAVATPATVPVLGTFSDRPDWAAIAVEIRN